MDTRNGRIYSEAEAAAMAERDRRFMKQMVEPPTPAQMRRVPPKVGRNEPCPCGSGKKFKKCCLVMHPAENG